MHFRGLAPDRSISESKIQRSGSFSKTRDYFELVAWFWCPNAYFCASIPQVTRGRGRGDRREIRSRGSESGLRRAGPSRFSTESRPFPFQAASVQWLLSPKPNPRNPSRIRASYANTKELSSRRLIMSLAWRPDVMLAWCRAAVGLQHRILKRGRRTRDAAVNPSAWAVRHWRSELVVVVANGGT